MGGGAQRDDLHGDRRHPSPHVEAIREGSVGTSVHGSSQSHTIALGGAQWLASAIHSISAATARRHRPPPPPPPPRVH